MNRRAFMAALTGSAVAKPVVKPISVFWMYTPAPCTFMEFNRSTGKWKYDPWAKPGQRITRVE
jgi:hypothetical protein